MNNDLLHSDTPIHRVKWSGLNSDSNEILIKRDDLIHPFISGNKWRKLKYNVEKVKTHGLKGITTFGGAFSNHLLATACACSIFGIKSIAYVRGEELSTNSNFILRLCTEYGMELNFISRADYKDFSDDESFGRKDFLTVPEGGQNEEGIRGCEEILNSSVKKYRVKHVFCSVGTATTFCGIIRSMPESIHVHGIAGLRNASYLQEAVQSNTKGKSNWTLHTEFAGKGFGKYDQSQLKAMKSFTSETGILLDPIYTGKTLIAISEMYKKGQLDKQSTVLMIHTGGLTGILSETWLKMGND